MIPLILGPGISDFWGYVLLAVAGAELAVCGWFLFRFIYWAVSGYDEGRL